jgi:hypothetical protein
VNTQGALHTPDWYLDRYDALTARFADVLAGADLDLPVPACGDWTVAQLAGHLGWVHRWANLCATHARAPGRDEMAALEPLDPTPVGPRIGRRRRRAGRARTGQ